MAEGCIDHGGLGGLTDDDHTQYALLAGRAAGQTLSGDTGTTATDTLNLQPSSTTNYLGSINLCGNQGTPSGASQGEYPCLNFWPDGLTVGSVGVGYDFPAIKVGATITYPATTFANDFLFMVRKTRNITGGIALGSDIGLYFNPTTTNATAGAVFPGPAYAVQSEPNLSNTGGGSATVNDSGGIKAGLGTIGAGTTLTDAYVGGNVTNDGTVSGTLTRQWGWHVGALTKGTAAFQYGATEHAIKGNLVAGEAAWGVETGAPNRFYFKNESGHIWRTGTATWHALGTNGASGGLATATCTTGVNCPFLLMAGRGTSNATLANATIPSSGALHVYKMACAITAAPGTTSHRTMKLRFGATTSTNIAVDFGPGDVQKTVVFDTGEAVGAGVQVAVEEGVTTAVAVGADGNCTLWWNLDAF